MGRFCWSKNLTKFFGPASFSLKKNGVTYAVVQSRKDGSGYFAYGGQGCPTSFNTHSHPSMSLREAKDYALKIVKDAEKLGGIK